MHLIGLHTTCMLALLPFPPSPPHSQQVRRSTLFSHIAIPAALPQSLCEDDVEKFQEFSKWEQEVKRLEPWMLSEGLIQKVSLDPTPTSTSNSLLSATNNKDDIDESLAFATPRFQSKPLSPASPAANLDSFHSASSKNEKDDVSKFMLRPSQVSKRGKTFTSMEDIRKKSLIEKHATIQNPNNDLIISGMATLLSYLIEEPPDVYVKNQAWDIFSVPGDKTKIRAPLTTAAERTKNAGKCVVKKAVVEGESNATVQCSSATIIFQIPN